MISVYNRGLNPLYCFIFQFNKMSPLRSLRVCVWLHGLFMLSSSIKGEILFVCEQNLYNLILIRVLILQLGALCFSPSMNPWLHLSLTAQDQPCLNFYTCYHNLSLPWSSLATISLTFPEQGEFCLIHRIKGRLLPSIKKMTGLARSDPSHLLPHHWWECQKPPLLLLDPLTEQTHILQWWKSATQPNPNIFTGSTNPDAPSPQQSWWDRLPDFYQNWLNPNLAFHIFAH